MKTQPATGETYPKSDLFNKAQVLLQDDEFRAFQEILINDPEAGDTISGTGGFRKIRWSRPGMGKRGGVRVIYYNVTKKGRIYLALIYPKNEQDELNQEQKKMLRQVADLIN
ncbi:type II toxin-antitoxin system RelE/ParE family toxin [Klebsiella pneumoniae]|nr:type II toxin-antitoxin system RelE/ParE family toxin [Klebsiella pneumoniae]